MNLIIEIKEVFNWLSKINKESNYKTHFFIIPLFLVSTSSISQVQLSGVVIDTLDVPISFAPVTLLTLPDSTFVKETMTDEKGNYLLQLTDFGKYKLKVNVVGCQKKFSDELHIDSLSNKSITLNIKLNPFLEELQEVSISTIRRVVEFKNGNVTVNVEKSPLAKGNTVYDLLPKLPGVRINNNVIQLNGKSGVIIMLDGRIQNLTDVQLLNMLKSMNAEVVEKIELMKNPPVKYDASGTSGMINIKTKKTKSQGYSGSLYTSSSQGEYERSMLGASLNYKSDKIVVFSNLNYNYGIYQNKYTFNSKFKNDSSTTEFNLVNRIKDINQGLNYKLGADWQIDKDNIVGFKIDGGPASNKSKSAGTNTIYQDNNMGFDHLNVRTNIPDKWNLNNYNVNAEHRFDELGTVLVFNTDYTRLRENISSTVQNIFLDVDNQEALPSNIFRSKNINASNIFVSKLDFTNVYNDKTSFEAGAKASFINTDNNYLFERKYDFSDDYYTDTALTNNYSYSEQTYAGYFNYIKSLGKFDIQLGLRTEYTSLKGNNTTNGFEIRKNYFKLFPNISLEYASSENHNFQLNLNIRLDRPPYKYLMPFQFYEDQYNYFEGNPFLLPHYSNNIELTHSFKQSITNSFTYSRINNVWLFYLNQNDSSKITTRSFKNMKYNNYYAYSFFIQHALKPWWNISANALCAYIEYVGDVNGLPFKTASLYYAPSLTNTFSVPKKTKVEIIAFFNSPKNDGFLQIKSCWMLSFAIKKTFFNGKLDCSTGINDLFYSNRRRTKVNFENQNWNYNATDDTRRLVVSINYNFGKIKITERKITGNEEEKERLNH